MSDNLLMSGYDDEVARRLMHFRKRAKLTRDMVAIWSGQSPATIKRWEEGRTQPVLSQLSGLADLYGCSVEQFLPTAPLVDSGPIPYPPRLAFKVLVHPNAKISEALEARSATIEGELNQKYLDEQGRMLSLR